MIEQLEQLQDSQTSISHASKSFGDPLQTCYFCCPCLFMSCCQIDWNVCLICYWCAGMCIRYLQCASLCLLTVRAVDKYHASPDLKSLGILPPLFWRDSADSFAIRGQLSRQDHNSFTHSVRVTPCMVIRWCIYNYGLDYAELKK